MHKLFTDSTERNDKINQIVERNWPNSDFKVDDQHKVVKAPGKCNPLLA